MSQPSLKSYSLTPKGRDKLEVLLHREEFVTERIPKRSGVEWLTLMKLDKEDSTEQELATLLNMSIYDVRGILDKFERQGFVEGT